ncbi:ribonuclease HII [Patescibacteria group bacterium]|nr:ribonuclease HII [Patescibacteria group bacterium]
MVGAALVPEDFDWSLLPGVTDSKKLSQKKRESIYGAAEVLQSEGKLFYVVAGESAATIDEIGIVPAIQKALGRALSEVLEKSNAHPRPVLENIPRALLGADAVMVKLDGGLKAPAEFPHQETIIKGDAKESVIGLASIVAKVTRDREMVAVARRYPGFGLAAHKGYGTAAHREVLMKLGISKIHRQSFCRNIFRK